MVCNGGCRSQLESKIDTGEEEPDRQYYQRGLGIVAKHWNDPPAPGAVGLGAEVAIKNFQQAIKIIHCMKLKGLGFNPLVQAGWQGQVRRAGMIGCRVWGLCAVCLLLNLIPLEALSSPTQKSGIVAGETWTLEGSPYQITGNLLVASLTIEPGVEVVCDAGVGIEVAGTLIARGSQGNLIQFRGANTDEPTWGGIYFNESPIGSILVHCMVTGSTNSGVRIKNTRPKIQHCQIINNSAPLSGGGIQAELASGELLIEDVIVSGNRAGNSGQGTITKGGGISVLGNLKLLRSLVSSNTCHGASSTYGGGVYAGSGSLRIENSDISKNGSLSTYWNGRRAFGGGVFTESESIILNTIFHMNKISSGFGGGLYYWRNDHQLVNCTLNGNESGGVNLESANLAATSTIFWNNGATQISIPGSGSTATVLYSTVQGGFVGTGNLASNPVLDPNTQRLLLGSPCIDAGSPAEAMRDTCFPPSMGGERNDMGAYGGPGACFGIGPASDDSDFDGLPDSWEIQYFGDITSQNGQGDPDQDGLNNGDEVLHETHPGKSDTDGDGFSDFVEIKFRSNPLDPSSYPPPFLNIFIDQVRLEFPAGVGDRNIIEGSNDLKTWSPLEEVVGTGNIITRKYSTEDGYRHFRLTKP